MKSAARVTVVTVLAIVVSCSSQDKKMASSNVDDEIAHLKKELEASPRSATLHGQLAAMLATKGDWDASDKEMSIAVQLDAHDPMFYIEAAQRFRARQMLDKALEMAQRAVAVDAKNPLSHFNLALIYQSRSDRVRADGEFRETKRLIDEMSQPTSTPDVRNHIIKGPRGETWYHDQFGKDYLLDDIVKSLPRKLAQ